MSQPREPVIVESCPREGSGGSPTAVLLDGTGLADRELASIAAGAGVSHVAALSGHRTVDGARLVRFFTRERELPTCGHGTVAAITVLALASPDARFDGVLRSGGRDLAATGDPEPDDPGTGDSAPGAVRVVRAWFEQGVVRRRPVTAAEQRAFLAALGLDENDLHPGEEVVVASPGRERLLIPVIDREVLAGLRPDQHRLAAVSREFDQLGCFVYVPPLAGGPAGDRGNDRASGPAGGRAAGRMFAPAIGVPEDVANANSTGCLAAYLLATGRDPVVAVDQGDALARPSTVHASATWRGDAITTRVGGTARLSIPPT